MKKFFFVVPFALAFVLSSAAFAEDKAGEWTVMITVKDDAVTAKADDKEYVLSGDEAKKIKESGKYVVKGTMSDDGKTITPSEVKKAE